MFLDEKIGYLDIVKVVEETCETHKADLMQQPSLQARLSCPAFGSHVCLRFQHYTSVAVMKCNHQAPSSCSAAEQEYRLLPSCSKRNLP